MKKIVLTLLIVAFSALGFAQNANNVNILMGNETKAKRKTTLSDIIGFDDSGIYAVRTKFNAKKVSLEYYDNSMNLKLSQPLQLKTEGKNRDYEFAVHLNDKLYLFSSFHNQKLKKNFLFVETVNKKTLLPNNDLKKVAEIEYKRRWNRGDFNHEFSRDENMLMVFYNLPYRKGEAETFGFHVFDNEMNQVWHKDITLPYDDDLFDVMSYKVDNDGNAYVLGRVFKEKSKTKVRGKVNYHYTILSYGIDGQKAEYKVALGDRFLTDMQIAIADNSDIICGGFYSDMGTSSIKGTYFLTVDNKSKAIKRKNFKEFSMDFITQNYTERQQKKAKKKAAKGKDIEMYQYDLDDIILRSDGGAILVGEQYFVRVVTRTSTDSQGNVRTTTTYHYNYNDIIIVNMSPDGSIEWASKIPKKQVTVNDGGFYSSYVKAVRKDKLYFVFNDNPRNLNDLKQGQIYNFVPKKAVVVLAEVDMSGNVSKQALFDNKSASTITRPKVCEQISDDEIVIFGQRGRKNRFASVTFK
ncbi:hypothetical protein RCC89_20450 [Cytophagaceae bacterium ABcell3]|nr:hypothetical protein RCC89_20450 [Cytophagaceae bacterium ABcell3]